jgi:hypothetical protein
MSCCSGSAEKGDVALLEVWSQQGYIPVQEVQHGCSRNSPNFISPLESIQSNHTVLSLIENVFFLTSLKVIDMVLILFLSMLSGSFLHNDAFASTT